MEVKCRYCGSSNIVKCGTRNNKRKGKIQKYFCKDCKRYFSENTCFSEMKHKGKIITVALDLYCKNVSLRKIAEHLEMVYGVKVSHVTILKWIRKYSGLFKKFFRKVKVNNGESIHVDEMMVNINGKWYWWWQVLDKKTRMVLATHLSKSRKTLDAIRLLKEAKNKMQNKPDYLITDGLHAYKKAYTKTFYTLKKPRTEHIALIHFFDKINNNVIGRLFGSVRERTKVMRGFNQPHSAEKILDLWTFYYNFIRPHYSLGTTPAEVAGIILPLNGGNKWLELIKFSFQLDGFSVGKNEEGEVSK